MYVIVLVVEYIHDEYLYTGCDPLRFFMKLFLVKVYLFSGKNDYVLRRSHEEWKKTAMNNK